MSRYVTLQSHVDKIAYTGSSPNQEIHVKNSQLIIVAKYRKQCCRPLFSTERPHFVVTIDLDYTVVEVYGNMVYGLWSMVYGSMVYIVEVYGSNTR